MSPSKMQLAVGCVAVALCVGSGLFAFRAAGGERKDGATRDSPPPAKKGDKVDALECGRHPQG